MKKCFSCGLEVPESNDLKPQFTRSRHGSLFDRGASDSYYRRKPSPHWWPDGTGHGKKVSWDQLTPEEVWEYGAGYLDNEVFGDHKHHD